MEKRRGWIVAASIVALGMSGCSTMTRASFEERRQAFSDLEVCEAATDARRSEDGDFVTAVYREKAGRQLSDDMCELLAQQQRERVGAALTAFGSAMTATSAAMAKPTPSRAGVAAVDYSWQWDQFYAPNGVLMWACRGEQTGQFADVSRCAGKAQLDWRWPGFNLR